MQKQSLDDIISYPKKYNDEILHFLEKITLEQVKMIDQKRKNRQFMIIQTGCCNYSQSCDIHPGHRQKNRYGMLVYNHNRVIVNGIDNFYINGSLMRSIVDNQIFAIFSQAPLPSTFQDFWLASYHFNVKKIFMLCPLKGQADQYWPQKNETFQHQNLAIKCQTQQQSQSKEFTKRLIDLKGKDGNKSITHHHWNGWTDMKIPNQSNGEDYFKYLIKESLLSIQKKELILIHCSAGIGRTGTFGAIIQAIRCLRDKGKLSIFEIVDNLRRQRQGSVETFQQYCFLYEYLSTNYQSM